MTKEDALTKAYANVELNQKLFGGAVVLDLALGNPATPPQESEWVRFMPGTSKTLDLSPNSVTSDADDQGGFSETIVTNMDLTISFEGEVRSKDADGELGFHRTLNFIINSIAEKKQPALWARFNMIGSTLTGYMVITAYSSDGGTNDLYTCSAEFKVAAGKTVKHEIAK